MGAYRIDVGRQSRDGRERDGIIEIAGVAAAQIAGDLDLARLAPEVVTPLDFADQLKLLEG
jgi:hypothetical protein